jgi:DNA-binding response OmpR family regulator
LTILVADHDNDFLDLLGYLLRREGYAVLPTHDGVETLMSWQIQDPELVLLDVALPKLTGWDVCERICQESTTPLVFLTAVGDEEAIIRGLDLGADDYITKPFSPRLLLARIHAVLRRSGNRLDKSSTGRESVTVGELRVDPQFRMVHRDGEGITLTPTEFKLLHELVLHAGQVLTNQVLTDRVWGYCGVDSATIVKGQIYNLRRKLERDPSVPRYIQTIAGAGYTFRLIDPVLPPGTSVSKIVEPRLGRAASS